MVTIGVAFILFMLATAGVKGFALMMGLGTIVSLFTAVLATSAILGSISRSRMLRSRHALGAGRETAGWRFDFMGKSRWFFSASGLILVVGALAIAGIGINFGIDFESGTQDPDAARAARHGRRGARRPAARVPGRGGPGGRRPRARARTSYRSPCRSSRRTSRTRSATALDQAFGLDPAQFSTNSIGPTFGAQIAQTAVIAIIASLILISLYIGIRFEFKYAVPVLIAIAHDILITAGVYAIAEREVTSATVAALLTILGYSLYDTIIVFDRIRENVPRMPRATFSQIVNRSMSEVLTRSLATSFSTLLPITALMLFGGETLRDFGFALLVGAISGAYSSIFIASPVLSHWKEREPIYRRRRRLALQEHGGVVPAFATATIGAPAAGPGAAPAAPAEPVPRRAAEPGPAEPEREKPERRPRRKRKAGGAAPAGAGRQRLGRAGRDSPTAGDGGARAGAEGRTEGDGSDDDGGPVSGSDRSVDADDGGRPGRPKPRRWPQATKARPPMSMLVWVMMGIAMWHFTRLLAGPLPWRDRRSLPGRDRRLGGRGLPGGRAVGPGPGRHWPRAGADRGARLDRRARALVRGGRPPRARGRGPAEPLELPHTDADRGGTDRDPR